MLALTNRVKEPNPVAQSNWVIKINNNFNIKMIFCFYDWNKIKIEKLSEDWKKKRSFKRLSLFVLFGCKLNASKDQVGVLPINGANC